MKIKNYKIIRLFLLWFVFAGCISCMKAINCDGEVNMNNLHIITKNIGSQEIVDSSIKMGKYITVGGLLPPGKNKGHMFFNHPVTSDTIVSFEIENGESHKRSLNIKDKVAKYSGKDITIYFNINSDDFEVSVDVFEGIVVK